MTIVSGIHIWIMINGKQTNQIVKPNRIHVDTFQQVQAARTGKQPLVRIWIHLRAKLILAQ